MTEQRLLVPEASAVRVQLELLKLPVPVVFVKATLPLGDDFGASPVSVTTAVQVLPWAATTLPGTQVTAVVVGRLSTFIVIVFGDASSLAPPLAVPAPS